MLTTSFSEPRRNGGAAIVGANADREPVIVERDRGKPAAVFISVDDFASLEETAYLLRSPRDAGRLLGAVAAWPPGPAMAPSVLGHHRGRPVAVLVD